MFKKCMAKCYAGADKNLYLRGKIFYYMIELPRENGKRRYYIKSLHTDNYYEAREKVKDIYFGQIICLIHTVNNKLFNRYSL